MRIADLFDTPVEERIEPVIKVGETGDQHKLAGEIGSYVVTPMIEQYLDDILEHFTDTFLTKTTEIGTWISGYFGSGKSHFAKIIALLAENMMLEGIRPASDSKHVFRPMLRAEPRLFAASAECTSARPTCSLST